MKHLSSLQRLTFSRHQRSNPTKDKEEISDAIRDEWAGIIQKTDVLIRKLDQSLGGLPIEAEPFHLQIAAHLLAQAVLAGRALRRGGIRVPPSYYEGLRMAWDYAKEVQNTGKELSSNKDWVTWRILQGPLSAEAKKEIRQRVGYIEGDLDKARKMLDRDDFDSAILYLKSIVRQAALILGEEGYSKASEKIDWGARAV